MKKELFIFFGILVVLSFGMHYKEFFSYPIEHIKHLPTSSAYGLGFFHPLVFSGLIYLFLWIPRAIILFFKKKSQ